MLRRLPIAVLVTLALAKKPCHGRRLQHYFKDFDCPQSFERHGHSCYAFADGPATKTAASAVCEEYGAMLACPQSVDEAALLGHLAADRGGTYWIGATDVMSEGTWVFPCGSERYVYPWCPGEPNDSGGGSSGDCVRIVGSSSGDRTHASQCQAGGWADHDCAATRDDNDLPIGFVCEINEEKQAYWWEDWDDWEDWEDEGEKADGPKDKAGDANPVAIVFAVLGCLGCCGFAMVSLLLWRRLRLLRGMSRPIMSTMPSTALAETTTPYRAPLPQPSNAA